MIRKILNLNYKHLKYSNCLHKYTTESNHQNNDKVVRKDKNLDEKKIELVKKPILTRLVFPEERKSHKEKRNDDERKGPFKNYFESEERDKKQIMYYEEYFDTATRKKDLDNFMVNIYIYIFIYTIILNIYIIFKNKL
jgi:hypothetical protein